MKRYFSVMLALSALVLTAGCKKTIKSSVDLAGKAKAGFAPNSNWQLPGPSGRITRYDIGDGDYSDCLLAYDISTGVVSLDQFSNEGTTSTTVYQNPNGFETDNAGTISVTQYSSDVTDNYNELGGVHIIPYDATSDGHEDHLLMYIPGRGIAYLIHYNASRNNWHLDWSSTNGIGGYDLMGSTKTDKIITFDYGNGAMDHLICYRPGNGYVWVLNSNRGVGGSWTFNAVVTGSGIAGYDMKGPTDQLVCIGGPSIGNMNLAAYRPGLGYVWLIQHPANSNSFGGTWSSRSGFPGFSFADQQDRMVVISQESLSPNVPEDQGTMFCYRPGSGISSVEEYGWNSTIVPNSRSLIGPNNIISGLGSGLLMNNPYNNNGEGDHVLCFAGKGSSYNSGLLFYTNDGIHQSQLYYWDESNNDGYYEAY